MTLLSRPALIVFSGLPGTGKTTVSRALAGRIGALHLRIDIIEQAMRNAGIETVGPAGYSVSYAVAGANLQLGHSVVADCVNPIRESRAAWRETADRAHVPLIEIELVCSDALEHRRRVDERVPDIPGLSYPSWEGIARLHYEPWETDHLVLDTTILKQASLIDEAEAYARLRVREDRDQGQSR